MQFVRFPKDQFPASVRNPGGNKSGHLNIPFLRVPMGKLDRIVLDKTANIIFSRPPAKFFFYFFIQTLLLLQEILPLFLRIMFDGITESCAGEVCCMLFEKVG